MLLPCFMFMMEVINVATLLYVHDGGDKCYYLATSSMLSLLILVPIIILVYSAAKHTVVITASSLSALRKQNKGTDASNLYDEEVSTFLCLNIMFDKEHFAS